MAGPADDGGNAEAAFPRVLLDAVKRPVIAEELRILAAFIVGAVVRRHDDDGIPVNVQVFQGLDEVFKGIAQPRDHGGVPLLRHGPFLVRIARVDVRVDLAFRGIDQLVWRSKPLHPALHATAFRVGAGGYLKLGVGRDMGQRQEKGLPGILAVRINNPFFGAGRQQVHGVGLVAIRCDALVPVPDAAFFGGGDGVGVFLGIMMVAADVVQVPEVVVKAAFRRVGRGFLRGARVLPASAYPPFADEGRPVARGLHDGAQRGPLFDGQVKGSVPDYLGMALVHPREQGGAGRGAERGGGIVARQRHSFAGQCSQAGIVHGGQSILHALVLVGGQVPPAHVVHQDQDDVGPLGGSGKGNSQKDGQKGK